MSAIPHLQKQFREMSTDPPAGFRVESDGNLYCWTVWFSGPHDTPYAGGQYKAQLTFPKEFPMEPPSFRIMSSFWHPNVYEDGRVCISILHPPGEDAMNTLESAMMRWTPVQTIRSVLISIVSLLSDPDPKDAGAPANVDALVQYRNDRDGYKRKCATLAQKSLRELPADFVPPSTEERIVRPYVETPLLYLHEDDDDMDNGEDGDGVGGRAFGVYGVHAGGGNNTSSAAAAAAAAVLGGDDVDAACARGQPVAPVTGPQRYLEELRQLRGANIDTTLNDDELLQLLCECRGNVDEVLVRLFS